MNDGVLQAMVGGVFAVMVALINKLVVPKGGKEPIKEGVVPTIRSDERDGAGHARHTGMSKKLSFTRTGVFVWIVAPVVGALIASGIFLAGFNGVQAVAGSGPVPLKAPVAISGNFYPSGFMGDIKRIDLNAQWSDNCHPGPTCVRVKYTPGGMAWAGVYWQYPDSNWGDQPGRKIEGAKKLVFWARGQVGGELVSFRVGGIQGKKYQDSLDRALDPSPARLTTEWQQYQIALEGTDMSSVIGAFSWSIAKDGNPQGAIFYLDGISFKYSVNSEYLLEGMGLGLIVLQAFSVRGDRLQLRKLQ
jgi:hypothetical protein